MAVNVGGVMVEFDGDASGAAAAMKAVSEKLDDLTRKEKELKDALDAATKAGVSAEGGLNALRRAHSDAAAAVEKMRGSAVGVGSTLPSVTTHASTASASMSSLRNAGQAVDNVMGPLQTTLGGVGQALGASTGTIQNLVGGMADLGMIVEKMGWWGAALAAVGVAAAAVAQHFSALEEAATKAAEESAQELADLRDELQTINDELDALRTGGSVEIIVKERRLAEETAKAQEMGESFKSKYGDVTGDLDKIRSLAKGSRDLWVQVWDESSNEMKKVRVAASDIVKDWEAAWTQGQKVGVIAAQIRTIEEKSKEEAAKAAMDRLAKQAEADEKLAKAQGDKIKKASDPLAEAIVEAAGKLRLTTKTDLSSAQDDVVPRLTSTMGLDLSDATDPVVEDLGYVSDGLLQLGFNTKLMSDEAQTFGIKLDSTDGALARLGENIDRTANEIAAADVGVDFRSLSERFADAMNAAGEAATKAFEDIGGGAGLAVTAIKGGASGVGQAAGGIAGMAIGTAVGGPAGAQVGSALGSALGGLLGDALDKLIESLGVLTPLFNAIGTIIGALQPILVVLGGLFVSIGDAIVSLAPIIIILSRLIGALLIPVVRVAQLLLLLVPIISLVASIILVWVDYLTVGIGWLDEYFFTPIIDGAMQFVNVIIMAYNFIIDLIRKIPGLGEFGTKADYLTRDGSATAGVDDMINDVAEAAALGAAEGVVEAGDTGDAGGGGTGAETKQDSWGNDLANVPSGFKAMAAIYASADAESGAGMFTPMQTMEMTINIENWNSKGDSQRDWDDLRRLARNGHKGKKASSSRFAGDEKN